ncbi:MAG: M28 family peptidase [Planctomycetes bacterium]|nr:M28 family peptidase [Planctomycetota bacterium]
MRTSPELVPALLLAALLAPLSAQTTATEPLDQAAVDFLKTEGLQNSQVMEHLSWICDVYGPRLTGSPNIRRAQDWAVKTFTDWGLAHAHTETWGPFGDGWQLEAYSARVTGDNPWQVIAVPKAWSPSIAKTIAKVVYVGNMSKDELEKADLKGCIVLLGEPRALREDFTGEARRFESKDLDAMEEGGRSRGERRRGGREAMLQRWQRMMATQRLVHSKQPLALLDCSSKGDYGTLFVQGASVSAPEGADRRNRPRPQDPKGAPIIPQLTLVAEHFNRLVRVLKKNQPVSMEIEIRSRVVPGDRMGRNVVAEIPGSDPKLGAELVMLGAHFDSWHSATGATDNGCGSAVVMEAVRLLQVMTKQLGRKPRRTIRVALWSGEEQGLLGSRAFVRQHFAEGRGDERQLKPDWHRLSGYFNLDNGTGRIRGVYLQGNRACGPIFRAWLAPFADLDAKTINPGNTGGTDHQAFDGVGLPGFQFVQDPVAYNARTHHSNMDNWDHAVAADLRQAATIMASFVWHTAQRDAKLPRKQMPADASATQRR